MQPLIEPELSDAFVRGLIEAAPDGIVVTDEAGVILLVNRQTEELFGYDRGELLGHPVDDLLPDHLRQVHRAHRTRYRVEPRTRSMGAGLALLGRRKNGKEFPVEISLSPLHVEGRLTVVAAVRDISERMAREAEEQKVHAILDATRDGVFIFDGNTLRFSYVNAGATEQVGYTRDELLTMTPLHIMPEYSDSEFRALLRPLDAEEVSSSTLLTVHRTKDGADVPIEVVLQAAHEKPDSSERSFVALVRDIRERIEAEDRLRRTEHELHQLEDRERIARDLHDIVIQKLFAAGMTLQGVWARSHEPEIAQRVAGVVEELDDTIREVRSVIFGLQANTEAGGLRHEILRIIAEERLALGFDPRVRFDGVIEGMAEEVAAELLPTLREALSNVARHASASEVQVTIVGGDEIRLTIADDGCGIPDTIDAGHGVRNMRDRAVRLGGSCRVSRGIDGGTIVEWLVPSHPSDHPAND